MKINSNIIFCLALCSCCIFTSCNDLVDRNLSSERLEIESPSDNFVTSNYVVFFLWQKVADNAAYRIQIVEPSFSNIQQFVVDTIVTGTKFSFSLLPGSYQWRIRTENGSSTSAYISRNIKVDSNSNLTSQTFIVNTPKSNYFTNNTIVNFGWSAFPFASVYEYVITDTFNNLVHDKKTVSLGLSDTLSEGFYWWKVRAIDSTNGTSTLFSIPNHLCIDTSPPIVASPQSPANNSVDTGVITFRWNHASDVVSDSLIISNDSLFSSIVFTSVINGEMSFAASFLVPNQNYFWRLRSKDLAGNWSIYSMRYKFYLH